MPVYHQASYITFMDPMISLKMDDEVSVTFLRLMNLTTQKVSTCYITKISNFAEYPV